MKKRLLSMLAGLALVAGSQTAQAQPVKFGICYDLSKAYTFVTPQIVQAVKDYADILNAKGGIEGHPIELMVQDHGNEPQRGIECYEKLKREGVMIFDTLSTPVSRAVLPRAMADQNILLQSFVGRGDAIDGDVFKWVFPIGPTYWGQVANDIQYIKNQHKGNLKGVKVGFIYPDYAFGQEPIPILKTLAAKEGFDLQLFPNPLPGKDQACGVDADSPLQPGLGHHLEPVCHARGGRTRDEAQWHSHGKADLGELVQRGGHCQHWRS
jgi:branched-chain amino acid transport system substrate-binding protein